MRVLTGVKRIGHTGTLDPFASGVLVLAFDDATKLIPYIPSYSKSYDCTLFLGEERETADCTGAIVSSKMVPTLTRETLDKVLLSFYGQQKQTPPIYSAIKVQGRKLYEYARAGENVVIPSRIVQIDSIRNMVLEASGREISFTVDCSKGTYIRSLGCDVAKSLGTVGHLNRLRRLQSDGIAIEQCVTFEQLAFWAAGEEAAKDWEIALRKEGKKLYPRIDRSKFLQKLQSYCLSVRACFEGMASCSVDQEMAVAISQGKSPKIQIAENQELVQILWNGELLAIAKQQEQLLKLQRVNPSIIQLLRKSC